MKAIIVKNAVQLAVAVAAVAAAAQNNSGGNNFKKKAFPLKSAFKGGKFNPSKSAGKHNSKYGGGNGGGNSFMNSERNFIPRDHFNTEKLSNISDINRDSSDQIHRALTTRVGYSNCHDSGSDTIVNHKIENFG